MASDFDKQGRLARSATPTAQSNQVVTPIPAAVSAKVVLKLVKAAIGGDDTGIKEAAIEQAEATITQHIREAEVRARIDELTKLQHEWYLQANGILAPKPNALEDWIGADIYDRINSLKAELTNPTGAGE